MLAAIRKRLNREDEGFTLIELMVVVLIIGILVAIAVPTFLGARGRAQTKQVQSNVRNGFSAEKSAFTDNQAYVAATTVQADEPSLKFHDMATAVFSSPKDVNVELVTIGTAGQGVCIWAKGANNVYYGLRDIAVSAQNGSGTSYWSGSDIATRPTCNATLAIDDPAVPAGWLSSWK